MINNIFSKIFKAVLFLILMNQFQADKSYVNALSDYKKNVIIDIDAIIQ